MTQEGQALPSPAPPETPLEPDTTTTDIQSTETEPGAEAKDGTQERTKGEGGGEEVGKLKEDSTEGPANEMDAETEDGAGEAWGDVNSTGEEAVKPEEEAEEGQREEMAPTQEEDALTQDDRLVLSVTLPQLWF